MIPPGATLRASIRAKAPNSRFRSLSIYHNPKYWAILFADHEDDYSNSPRKLRRGTPNAKDRLACEEGARRGAIELMEAQMAVENTDLERRVLAHEQILQALMAQIAEGRPDFLDAMRQRFASARRGAYEYDYVETADYAEAFIREVMRLMRVRGSAAPQPAPPSTVAHSAMRADARPSPVIIRSNLAHGVWHVTCDDVFLGDYLSEDAAQAATDQAAADLRRTGRSAEIVFGPR